MIKVSYTYRADDRMGFMENGEKRFSTMPEVYDFLKRVMINRRVDGKLLIGKPLVEDVQG